MKRHVARLAFLHRTLWQRDPTYRWAVLLGPPPAIGCLLAALAWTALSFGTPGRSGRQGDAPWVRWDRPVPQDGQPYTDQRVIPLPATDAGGHIAGSRPGWLGAIMPITVDATGDADVLPTRLATFTLDQPDISLASLLEEGPPTGLYVGVLRSFFVIPAAGIYAFSVRLTRSDTRSAECLVRLGSAHHRMVRSIVLHAAGHAVLDFPATEFRLERGLLFLSTAVGCWRGDQVVGAGDLIVTVRAPGERTMAPAAASSLIRPVPP